MIEYLMLITLGACGASLIWLGLWPALARRTDRLARRRIEATLPMSVAEFAGERDQLRAALAVKEALIEKRAEALAAEHAQLLAQAGRADMRIATLEAEIADEARRHIETATERERLNVALAETSATLQAEQDGHATLNERFAALDAAHGDLIKKHEALANEAERRHLETAALQAEREALLGRIEGLEAALRASRSEQATITETVDARHVEIAVLKAERETHLERLARLESNLGAGEVRLAELGDLSMKRNVEKTEAELRVTELATRLAASDAHGARLALDLGAANERLISLAALHQTVSRHANDGTEELASLRRQLDAEHERTERAEAAERLHVARAEAELRELAQVLERQKAELRAANASLEEMRGERDRLQTELARSAARSNDAPSNSVEAHSELVSMIEQLADDIARASGVGPLPPITASTKSPDETHQAAAE